MIDLEELRNEIRTMTKRTKIYAILREELSKKGYWKHLPRGNPQRGYYRMLEKMDKSVH